MKRKKFTLGSKCLNNGFTLIELLVVVVIVGILATISVAQFNEYQERARQAKSIAFAAQVERSLEAKSAVNSLGSFLKWKFEDENGVITDSSGNGNDSTFNTSGSTKIYSTDTPVNIGQSFRLTGANHSITNLTGFIPTTAVTMSTFVKFIAIPSGVNSNFIYFSSAGGLQINTNGQLRFNHGTASINATTDEAISLDKWYHIVASYDGDRVEIYIDGDRVLDEDVSDGADFTSPDDRFRIGPTNVTGFEAIFDDVLVYPVSLEM